jgi:hypothetical protein
MPDQRSSPTGETCKFSISFIIVGSFFIASSTASGKQVTAADHLLNGLSICVLPR